MRLQLLDIFSKTAEEARVRTASGGIVSLSIVSVLVFLVYLQFQSYFSFVWDHSLEVDTFANEDMLFSIDVTFPHLPCEMLTVDMMNDAGDNKLVDYDKLKLVDLDSQGNLLDPEIKERQLQKQQQAIKNRDPNREYSCYGAEKGLPSGQTSCMTCADIKRAFSTLQWQFGDGSGFEQCIEEGVPEFLKENKHNGCRVTGNIVMSRVEGRVHFAPGESFFHGSQHSHDIMLYTNPDFPYDLSHTIHDLRFGPHHVEQRNPLQDFKRESSERLWQYRYFLKVVGTEYQYKNGEIVDTNQYSVTHHERPLLGGRDEDHPHSQHAVGGVPGIWINYDISSMKVVAKEVRDLSLSGLLMNVFAIIGAVITVGAVVDKGVYVVDQALKARKER